MMLQTVDEEEMTRESLINEDVVKFDEIVDKKTEDVELRNTENVDIKVQTDNESVVKSYAEHKEALEKIEIFKDNKDNGFDNSTDTTEETTQINSFCMSTPKCESDRCEECIDKTECVDCVVKHVLRKHESLRKILF